MFNFLIGAITFIPAVLVAFILAFVALGSSLFAALGAVFLQWVIHGFTDLSYTNPGGPNANPLIATGLGITQGLVNLILVLVLIYIAIATILRLEGHQTKKLLVNFVIVALLVNFAPVICGVIVDAANILMNFFLQQLSGGEQIKDTWKGLLDTVIEGFSWKDGLDFGTRAQGVSLAPLEIAMSLAALTIANTVLFLVLFLFAFIFIARYVAIWILVILSPIAFAFRILPVTKKYWDMWWTQFIQWTIIGLTAGFFLFLAEQFTSVIGETTNAIHQVSPGKVGSAFLPSIVPIVFYIIALMASVQTSAMGAQAVMGVAKTSGRWLGRKAGGRIGRTLEDKLRIRETAKGLVSGVDRGRFNFGKSKIGGFFGKALGKPARLMRWAVPDMLRKYSENSAAIAELKGKFDKESSIALTDGLTSGRFSGIEAAAVMAILKDRGDGEDIMQAYMRKLGYDKKDPDVYNKLFKDKRFLQDKHLLRALDVLDGAGMKGKALRNEPRLARIGITEGSKDPEDGHKLTAVEAEKKQKEALEKAIRDSKPSDIATWEKEVVQDEELMEIFMGVKNEDSYRAVAGLKDGITRARRSFAKNLKKFEQDLSAGIITGYAATQEGYFDYLADKYKVKKSELGYRKLLLNNRMVTAGWGDLDDIILPAPGEAAMGIEERIAATPVPPRRPPEEGETPSRPKARRPRGTPPDQGEE